MSPKPTQMLWKFFKQIRKLCSVGFKSSDYESFCKLQTDTVFGNKILLQSKHSRVE